VSYARRNEESDVYVYDTGEDINCQWCILGEDFFGDRSAMIEHLRLHQAVGHKVPQAAFDRLLAELTGLIPTASEEIEMFTAGTHPDFQGPSAAQIREEIELRKKTLS